MHIVRRPEFKRTDWKNGGGVTHEALCVPAEAGSIVSQPFLWRLSVAEIASSGPFSDFTGFCRTMVLLCGRGIRLEMDGSRTELTSVGEQVTFDGAHRVHCALLDGPCVDLNLISSSRSIEVHSSVERLSARLPMHASTGGTRIVFCIEGAVRIVVGELDASLGRWDVAVMPPFEGAVLSPISGEVEAPLIFSAELGDRVVESG